MIIKRIYNNNVVLAINNENDKEVILTGKGIGFQKKTGQFVDLERIEKKFITEDEGFRNQIGTLATTVDENIFNITSKIIEHVEEILNTKLHEYIYVSLTDHIAFAIDRAKQNINIKNDLLYEIKRIHKKEFDLGRWAINYIYDCTGAEFPIDEAGFIAMHIVNSNYRETTTESMLMTNIVKEILNIIRYEFKVEFKEDDMNFERLLTHLKFFAQRLINKDQKNSTQNELIEIIKIKYEKSFKCALKIKTFIENKYDYDVSEDETVYLTLHINRIISVIKI